MAEDPWWTPPSLSPDEIWFQSLPPYTIDLTGLTDYPCVKQIATDVIALSNSTIKVIKDLFGESAKFNIKFVVDPTLTSAGQNNLSPLYYQVNGQYGDFVQLNTTIKLNPNLLAGGTKLSIAQTIIHEMIHSYFAYRSIDAAGDLAKEEALAQELGFLKPYDPNASAVTFGNQHEQMAANFIEKIVSALKEYKLITDQDLQNIRNHFSSQTIDIDTYYRAMAWGGLTMHGNGYITKAWETFKTNNLSIAQMYETIISAEQNATPLSASQEKCQ
jgi:hypothetical protein